MVRISPNPSYSITWQADYGRAACHIPMATSVTQSGKTQVRNRHQEALKQYEAPIIDCVTVIRV